MSETLTNKTPAAAAAPPRKQFVIGFVSEPVTLTSSWIGRLREEKGDSQPVAIVMRSRVALFTDSGHGGSKVLQTLKYGAECDVTSGRRLAEFPRPLPEYQYCIFGKISSVSDLAIAAKVLNISIDPKLVRELDIGEFLIWPAPDGLLRFRASQLGNGYAL